MKCDKCDKRTMVKIGRIKTMAEIEEDEVSEGQMADHIAAKLSGDFGEWTEKNVEYECNRCGYRVTIIEDGYRTFEYLISEWHKKTNSGDYFTKYIFEYLAFMAYLRLVKLPSYERESECIKEFKNDSKIRNMYLKMVKDDNALKNVWKDIVDVLQFEPLMNTSYDLENPEIIRNWNGKNGVIESINDWENMVEFWVSVRNNLFHGGKDPLSKRDIFLVENAFKTLNKLMNLLFSNNLIKE